MAKLDEIDLETGIGKLPATNKQHSYRRIAVLSLLAAGLVAGTDRLVQSGSWSGALAAEQPRPGFGPATYSEAMKSAQIGLELGQSLVRQGPDQWLPLENLGQALIERAALTGSHDELARAASIIAKSRRLAPAGSGPLLTDAVLGLKTHRLGSAAAALTIQSLAAVPPLPEQRSDAANLAGDIAFYRGDMIGATNAYAEASQIAASGATTFRRGIVARSRGEFDAAIAFFRESLRHTQSPGPLQIASVTMQIGAIELARGDLKRARQHFAEADRNFSGFWLFEAHLAQTDAAIGDRIGALVRLREIAQRSQNPEVMDSLAMILRSEGNRAESRLWSDRAGRIWRRRLTLLPEAAYGHAAEHELAFGSPAKALVLARRNLAARPYGESRVLLANALIASGLVADAITQLRLAEASGWRSAPLYALRAQALALSGDSRQAEQARQQALRFNPQIFAPQTALVWLSHG